MTVSVQSLLIHSGLFEATEVFFEASEVFFEATEVFFEATEVLAACKRFLEVERLLAIATQQGSFVFERFENSAVLEVEKRLLARARAVILCDDRFQVLVISQLACVSTDT